MLQLAADPEGFNHHQAASISIKSLISHVVIFGMSRAFKNINEADREREL